MSEADASCPSLRAIPTVMGDGRVSPNDRSDELCLPGMLPQHEKKQHVSSLLLLSWTLPQPQAEKKYAAHVLAEGKKT